MERVKKLRKLCRVTQVELANELGIEQSNYCNMENGKLIPNSIKQIESKAISILLNRLNIIIEDKTSELNELNAVRKSYNNG